MPRFTVNSTGDENDLDFPSGTFDGSSDGKCDVSLAPTNQCTLRAAIQAANKRRGADTIAFKIPGGVQTISPGSALPTITRRVTIDGYTQPGADPNTLPVGTNASPLIELDGPGSFVGLELKGAGASNSVIRGLVINEFDQGIRLLSGTGYKIQGNFIGTDPSGTVDEGNRSAGVSMYSSYSTLGGTSPGARNLISGNGLGIQAYGTVGSKIQGNLIGTKANGTGALNNGGGIIIGSNLGSPSKNNVIGGTASGAANTIAFNVSQGIKIDSPATGIRILSNSIFSNILDSTGHGGLGINLSGGTEVDFIHYVNANDDKDPDTGPNNFQNYPVLNSVQIFHDPVGSGTSASIGGTLNSTPSTPKKKSTFIIQFFSSPDKDPSDYGEGKTFIGQTEVTTDRDGNASFAVASTQEVSEGEFITATATTKKTGDTSEFSKARVAEDPGIGVGP